MPMRTFPGHYDSLTEISKFVAQAARKAGFKPKQVYAVRLAVDEACSNIIEHAYGGEGRGEIACACDVGEGVLTVTLRDWGQRFDPDNVPLPNYDVPLEKLQRRGAGVYLMRQLMDEVEYQFSAKDGNTLKLTKRK